MAVIATVLGVTVIVGGAVARVVGAMVVGVVADIVGPMVIGAAVVVWAAIVHRPVILGRTPVLHVLGMERLGAEIAHPAAEVAHAAKMAAAEAATEVTATETASEVAASAEAAAARIRVACQTENAE